jgi:sRNA-binding carbon storage regulator CsrA
MIGDAITVTVLGVKGHQCGSASPHPRTLPCIAKDHQRIKRRRQAGDETPE